MRWCICYKRRGGEIIGLAYGAVLKHKSCSMDAVDEAYHNPLFALAMARMLSAPAQTR